MVWTPTLYSISRPLVVRNLLTYIGANQTEAHAWAKTELAFAGAIPDYSYIYNSSGGRSLTNFPLLMLVRRRTQLEEADDEYGLQVTHTLGFELLLDDADPDVLTEKMEVYLMALKSMIWKVPRATLTQGFTTQGHPIVNVTDDDGDETRGGSQYVQIPQVIATISLLEVRQ